MGSGTTALVARNLDRKFVGIDISPEYCEMAEERLSNPASVIKNRATTKSETKQATLFDCMEIK